MKIILEVPRWQKGCRRQSGCLNCAILHDSYNFSECAASFSEQISLRNSNTNQTSNCVDDTAIHNDQWSAVRQITSQIPENLSSTYNISAINTTVLHWQTCGQRSFGLCSHVHPPYVLRSGCVPEKVGVHKKA
jgi:hypothetical protein